MEKRKIDVTIAGTDMTIVTDEKQEIVERLVASLDEAMTEILNHSKTCSKLDAAILVALDLANEKFKAEKRARNLEAQIQLYDTNLRRTKDENTRLKSAMLTSQDMEEDSAEVEIEEDIAVEAEPAPAEPEKTEQLGFDAAEEVSESADADSKADKLSQIENLLRGRGI